MKIRSLAVISAVLGIAPAALADYVAYGTYQSDGYLTGYSGSNSQGYVNVTFTGYCTPYTGAAGFKVRVWSSFNNFAAPIYTEAWRAYANSTTYTRNGISIPRGYYTTVEILATGSQYANDPNLSVDHVTYAWITMP